MAFAVRAAIFIAPLVAAWLVLRLIGPHLYRPEIRYGTLVLLVQSVVISGAAALGVDRLMVRFLPLATLMGFSLTFPDQAPSRFGVALKSGTVKQLERRIDELRNTGLSADVDQAARQAIELVTMLSRHDRLTRGHTERVRAYTDLIATEMGMGVEERNKLAWGALLHDIGKITVPAEILNKDGRPDEDEWKILQNHPKAGEDFVEPLAAWLGPFRLATSQHHEKWDGTGYPYKLAGLEISLAGRVVAVADAYDVITSKRSYKQPMSVESARAEMVRCSGSQFDPAVVRALLNASLRKRRNAGFFAWLLELPAVARSASSVVSIPAAAAIAATALSIPSTTIPFVEELGFSEPNPASSTTTPASSTTTVDGAPTTDTSTTTPGTPAPTTTPGSASTAPPLDPVEPEATSTTTTDPAGPPTTEAPATGSSTTAPLITFPLPTVTTPGIPVGPTIPDLTTTVAPSATTTTTSPTTTTAPTTTSTAAPTTTTTAPTPVVAVNDTGSVLLIGTTLVAVLNNDQPGSAALDPSTLRITDPPDNGTVTIEGSSIRYRPQTILGVDTFRYEICDLNGLCDDAQVSITVLALF